MIQELSPKELQSLYERMWGEYCEDNQAWKLDVIEEVERILADTEW